MLYNKNTIRNYYDIFIKSFLRARKHQEPDRLRCFFVPKRFN